MTNTDEQNIGRILLVEDDPEVRAALVEILTLHGYPVIEAENGDQALERISADARSIALLITDIVMPGISVENMIQQVVERYPGVKVMAMSGYDARGVVEMLKSRFGAEFLPKPLSLAVLVATVRRLMEPSAK